MTIPDYFQEISDFASPNGHPKQTDFIAEGLTTTDPATGLLIWNAAGQAVINELISRRFERAIQLYEFISELKSKLSHDEVDPQLVGRGYYAMCWAARALSLTLCGKDWGMGRGNHGNLPTHLERHTRSDSWYPKFNKYLTDWRSLRNCADYNFLTVLVYSGRYAGRRPSRVRLHYPNLGDAAFHVGNTVEEYLQESQRLIISRGGYLVRTI